MFSLKSPLDAALGLTYISSKGFFVGGGLVYNFNVNSRDEFGPYESESADYLSGQIRIGFHPGVRVYVAAGAAPAAAPAAGSGGPEPSADGQGSLQPVHG